MNDLMWLPIISLAGIAISTTMEIKDRMIWVIINLITCLVLVYGDKVC
jgi:hypothetical protein